MPTTDVTIAIIVLLFFSSLLRSSLGFGDALVAMPILSLLIDLETATPFFAITISVVSFTILLRHWRQVDLQDAWRLIVGSIIGIPIGIFVLKNVSEQIVLTIMGVILVGYGLYNLIMPSLPRLRGKLFGFGFGFVAGILGGAYNTNGPPVVIYGTLRHWSPEHFRATLQGYFFPTGLFILAGHLIGGLWTPTVLKLSAMSIPGVFIATILGGYINHHVPQETFKRVVYVFLVVIGVYMIVS